MLASPSIHHRHHQHSLSHNSCQYSSQSTTPSYDNIYSTPITPTQSVYDLPSSTYSNLDYNNTVDSHNFNNLKIQVQRPFGSGQERGLMQSDHPVAPNSWHIANGQLTPTSARTHHQRESSLSSLGSAGPASPYHHSLSHPQVLLPSDSVSDAYYDNLSSADQASYYLSKHPSHTSHDYLAPFQQNFNQTFYSNPHYASIMAMQKQADDESMPAPDYAHSARPSVASTHESPSTPPGDDFENPNQSRKIGEITSAQIAQWLDEYLRSIEGADFNRLTSSVPKLDRTMSDAYNDELYSPSFTFTSAPSIKPEPRMIPPQTSDIFSQRLQAANNQHLSASSQPAAVDTSRGRSPFRQGSPLAPTSNTFSTVSPQTTLGSAAQIRERQKAENDARALQQQIQRSSPEQHAPKTISPKDALLDYTETAEDAAVPLFPPQAQSAPQYRAQNSAVLEPQADFEDTSSQQSFRSMATSRRESSSYSTSSQATPQQSSGFNFAPPSVPGGVQVPQQYPFVPQQRRQPSNMSNTPDFPSTLTSMESSSSDYVPESLELKKPASSNADSGTYTCTYHGCTLRFDSPAKLQKHKREGHRGGSSVPMSSNSNGDGSDTETGIGMTSSSLLRNSQAGPHKCERINPSTGKPCNTIFSRPYDLTRHEDTIHNARKQKVRCHLCTEEKLFSRNDALTRHLRVVHPEADFPGKHRKRGGHE